MDIINSDTTESTAILRAMLTAVEALCVERGKKIVRLERIHSASGRGSMYIKVSEAKRLFWMCRIFGHWFRWLPMLDLSFAGDCRICKAQRMYIVTWPSPARHVVT